ncbi:alpha-ketoglutarate-dependent dioxygenase AlkB [Desertimonas flava]|uniref:alpha-ketoglutarate-dependent dioxygenase AlkB n=1 Tax=Desertimonas flava TaxID=2064846 RepID=UPI001877EB8B|nr:alpha-ketoglutarate-dependent dioxygenase AlkB [Desertimonas flava]
MGTTGRVSVVEQPVKLPASRLGVPTVLPPDGDAPRAVPGERLAQLSLDLTEPVDGSAAPERPLPGVVLIRRWLDLDRQRDLVAQFRTWAVPPAGLRHPRMPTGHLMSVQSVCLGWHWYPYVYSRHADDTDAAPVKPLPADLVEVSRRAVADTGPWPTARFEPDAAIVNLYAPGSKLGLHQDGEEPSDAPVVTISLGDTCVFRLAAVDRRTGPFTDLELRSGDLLVFGGENRRIFHGVPKVRDGTAPGGLGLPPGRLSITVRETGLGR